MKHVFAVTLIASGVLQAMPPDGGDTRAISGTVRYTGELPPAKKILTTDGATILHHDLVVDAKTKGLCFVLATLDATAQPKLKKAKPVLVDQRDMVFLPRVVAVQHGQAVRFDNSDLCNHSVMASSTVAANQFNLVAVPSQSIEHVFEPQKRPVVIGCSLHDWMRAWVYVVQHPWFAVTDKAGAFRIENVPAGKHTVVLRHADTNREEKRTLEVRAGKVTNLDVEWK